MAGLITGLDVPVLHIPERLSELEVVAAGLDELTADEAVSLCIGAAAGHVVGRDEVWDLASAFDDEVPRGAGTAEGEGFEVGLVVIEEDESRAVSSLSTDLFVLGEDGSGTESTEVHVKGGEALAGRAVEGL